MVETPVMIDQRNKDTAARREKQNAMTGLGAGKDSEEMEQKRELRRRLQQRRYRPLKAATTLFCSAARAEADGGPEDGGFDEG